MQIKSIFPDGDRPLTADYNQNPGGNITFPEERSELVEPLVLLVSLLAQISEQIATKPTNWREVAYENAYEHLVNRSQAGAGSLEQQGNHMALAVLAQILHVEQA